jgi:hypothetical protein
VGAEEVCPSGREPGLAGLMDGSVSTLSPIFVAAFATRNPSTAFLVGIAASLGERIGMGFAEAFSDDGVLSGQPLKNSPRWRKWSHRGQSRPILRQPLMSEHQRLADFEI